MPSLARKFLFLGLAGCLWVATSLLARAQQLSTSDNPPTAADHALSKTEQSNTHKKSLAGVPNFGEVNTTLYRGGQPMKDGFDKLAKMGIQMIVDLREGTRDDERAEVTKLGMEYIPIPWRCGHPNDKDVAEFLSLLRANAEKKIFVHCYYGTDRTGMMIAAYRMTEQGWSAARAKKEMQNYGFSLTHQILCPGLSSYEEKFPAEYKTSPSFQDLRAPKPADDSAVKP